MKKKTVRNKKNRGRLLEGTLVGVALGVAAGILLAPKSGKKMRTDIKKLSGDFYRSIAPQVKKMKKASEEQYDAFIARHAENFAKLKKLSHAEGKILTTEATRSWKRIKKHLV